MAKATTKPQLNVSIHFEVDELEARALEDLAGYGDDAFIKAFYEHLGKSYMEKHEQGLRRFLQTIRTAVAPGLHDIQEARQLLENRRKERSKSNQ